MICGFFVWGSFALAETRAAFVVGNGAYENSAPLENPTNDAQLVSASLEAVGFEVTTHIDLTGAAFGRALSEFLFEQEDTDVLFFYFAGHGMQLEGEILLLGTDASLQSEFDCWRRVFHYPLSPRHFDEPSFHSLAFTCAGLATNYRPFGKQAAPSTP